MFKFSPVLEYDQIFGYFSMKIFECLKHMSVVNLRVESSMENSYWYEIDFYLIHINIIT